MESVPLVSLSKRIRQQIEIVNLNLLRLDRATIALISNILLDS